MDGISEVEGKRKKTRPPRGAARRSIHSHVHSHPFEVRRKAVQLYLEEGFPPGNRRATEIGRSNVQLSIPVEITRDHRSRAGAGGKNRPAKGDGRKGIDDMEEGQIADPAARRGADHGDESGIRIGDIVDVESRGQLGAVHEGRCPGAAIPVHLRRGHEPCPIHRQRKRGPAGRNTHRHERLIDLRHRAGWSNLAVQTRDTEKKPQGNSHTIRRIFDPMTHPLDRSPQHWAFGPCQCARHQTTREIGFRIVIPHAARRPARRTGQRLPPAGTSRLSAVSSDIH